MLVKIIKKFDYVVIHEAKRAFENIGMERETGGKRSKRRIFIAFTENKNEIKRLFKINRH